MTWNLQRFSLPWGADELEGVDTIALHVGPIGRDAVVVQQPRQLQARVTHRRISTTLTWRPRDGAQHKIELAPTSICACSGLSGSAATDRRVCGKAGQASMHWVKMAGGASQCGQTQGGGRGSPGCASPPGRWSWGWAAGRAPGPQTGSRPG